MREQHIDCLMGMLFQSQQARGSRILSCSASDVHHTKSDTHLYESGTSQLRFREAQGDQPIEQLSNLPHKELICPVPMMGMRRCHRGPSALACGLAFPVAIIALKDQRCVDVSSVQSERVGKSGSGVHRTWVFNFYNERMFKSGLLGSLSLSLDEWLNCR